MRFSCLQENLKDGLAVVSKAVATKGSLPVLSHVLLKTDDSGCLHLSTTNLETSIITSIPATIHVAGAITVPARLLTDFVNNLPPTMLDLVLNGQTLHLETPSTKSKFNGLEASEFPEIPSLPSSQEINLDPKAFANAVSEVVFASAVDESRPILSGILLKIVGNELLLVGVDGFRLSERRLSLDMPFDLPAVVIPGKTLAEIARLVGSSANKLTLNISPDKNLAVFKSGDKFTIFARLLEGEFPDYERIIPSESKGRLTVDKAELINAVRLSNLFARDTSNILKITLDPTASTLTLAAATAEVGESTHTVQAEITGEGLQISFNGKYLLDLLNNVGGEKLTLETSGPLSPGLWRVVDRGDFLHLIMPVKTAS